MLGGIYKFGSNQGSIPINYLGTWNASTNNPALASGVGTNGDMYVVNVAGTTTLDGISDWSVGDWVVFNGPLGVYQKIDNTDSWIPDANGLTSTAFKLGVGVASSADYCINSTVASGNTGVYLKSSNGQCTSTLQGFGATGLSVIGENSSSGVTVRGLKGASISIESNTAGFDASLTLTADTAGSTYIDIGQGNAPGTTTDKLYNIAGVLTWNGVDISTPPISPTGIVFESAAGEKFTYPSSNPAPLDTDSGTNGTIKCHLFDSATDETIEGQFQLPSSLTGYTTINLEAYIYHKTAKTNKTVQMVFSHSAKNTTESWDGSYTDETSAAETVRDAADELYMLDWTETISNAGWAAGDQVRFKLWRDVSGDDLDEDACLTHFRVRLS